MSSEVRHRATNGGVEDPGSGAPKGNVHMKKNVGLIRGTSFIVGSVIGSGIFISPKGVLSGSGSVALSLIVWGASGLISLLGALSYAELGTMLPESGAEYVFFREGMFNVIAYLFAWTRTVVLQPSGVAIICMTFATYLTTLFEYCGAPAPPIKIVAVIAILTITMINCYDTAWASNIQVVFTIAKLAAIFLIIIGGFVWMGKGHVDTIKTGFDGTLDNPSVIALSFYDAMWAYDGWNTLNYLVEEMDDPYRKLPIANVLGVTLVTVVYILTNISYLVVLGKDGILNSDAVAVDWGDAVIGKASIILLISVLFSTFGAANGLCYSSGRLIYAAGRDGNLPEVMSYISVKRYTPIPSLVVTCVIAILMVIPADIGSLVDFFSFAAWLFYGAAVACVLVLRITRPDAERPMKVFIGIPIVFVICSLYLVIGPIIDNPQIELLYAFLFIIGGLIFYIPFVVLKLDRGCFDKVTTFIQLLCEVAPSPYEPEN